MSVPLNEQRRSELPLIAFTTCEPAALGVALFGFTASLADGPSGAPVLSGLLSGNSVLGASGALAAGALPALIAWTLCSIGMLASIGHLAKPLRAPRSLANLRSSWLSREILLVGAFWVALTAWVAASLAGSGTAALLFEAMGCVLGAILMYVIARAYQVSTRPAWCGPEGLMELWACVLGAGSAILFASAGASAVAVASPLVATVLAAAALGGVALDVASHCLRRQRLRALVVSSDERVPLTLERYAGLWSFVGRLWVLEALLCALLVAALLAESSGAVPRIGIAAAAVAIAVGQIGVHAAHRYLFYETPVQVRWVARLRK